MIGAIAELGMGRQAKAARTKAQRRERKRRDCRPLAEVRTAIRQVTSLKTDFRISGDLARFTVPQPHYGRRVGWVRRNGVYRSQVVEAPEPSTDDVLLLGDDESSVMLPAVWSEGDAAAWMAHVFKILRRLPMASNSWPEPLRSSMPVPVREAMEAYGYTDEEIREPVTTLDFARLDFVLGWLLPLSEDERKVVFSVAGGLSFRRIAKYMGCSHEQARIVYRRALKAIVSMLNES